jgi:50S ribosomal protein L16 3-hydroxylase
MSTVHSLLGGLRAAEFLDQYWQKSPLLVRTAFPSWQDPLSPEELAGLACDSAVESRIVRERGGRNPWQVRHGPFTDAHFQQLPRTHWTLLVQDVDKHLPHVRWVLAPFRFIPQWRRDDLMVSYAVPDGSVGPHWDDYDVFLIQGMGRRRWSISTAPIDPRNRLEGPELPIMAEFEPESHSVLTPGDMLYLPPGVAHFGVAMEPCMTYSVGFRAPAQRDLLIAFLEDCLTRFDPGRRFADPDLMPVADPGEIDGRALARLRQLLGDALALEPQATNRWLGRWLTEPKPGFEPLPPDPPMDRPTLMATLQAHARLQREPGVPVAWYRASDRLVLCAGGQAFDLPGDRAPFCRLLSQDGPLAVTDVAPWIGDDTGLDILLALVNMGVLVCED